MHQAFAQLARGGVLEVELQAAFTTVQGREHGAEFAAHGADVTQQFAARWFNLQHLGAEVFGYALPPSTVPSLFDVLEVYQYLLSPKSDDE